MSIILLLIGLLVVAGLVGTLVCVRNDGYRRLPHAPIARDCETTRWQ
jgi:hypothetical protein